MIKDWRLLIGDWLFLINKPGMGFCAFELTYQSQP